MVGHDVPTERIKARYVRTQDLIPRAAKVADITMIFDNSGRSGRATHTFVMALVEGRVTKVAGATLPKWVAEAYGAFTR